jgi:hypothetical protein
MESIDFALAIGITGFSVIMMSISLFSLLKTKVVKILPICIAFGLFFIKGLYFIFQLFNENSLSTPIRFVLALDFLIIIMIYIAVAKK